MERSGLWPMFHWQWQGISQSKSYRTISIFVLMWPWPPDTKASYFIPIATGHLCILHKNRFIVGWKKPIVFTFRPEEINLSGISPTKRSRSGKMGTETSAEPEFCVYARGNPDDLSPTSQRPIFTKFGHETLNAGRHFLNFHFRGHLTPKSEIASRSNRHFTQSRL